jgi:hypothetical protein
MSNGATNEEQTIEISPEEYEKFMEFARELTTLERFRYYHREALVERVYLPPGIRIRPR